MIRILTAIVHALHELTREVHEDREHTRRETLALHKENLEEAKKVQEVLKQSAQNAEAILEMRQEIEEIHSAVVSEPVAAVKLTDETGDEMDIEVGKPRLFRVDCFGASGNPTVPQGAPTLNLTDANDFTVDNAALSMTPTGPAGSATDITATADGVTSPALSYTIGTGVPVNEPVNSVVLVDITP